MTQVIVVARIKSKPEAVKKVRKELLKLIEPTQKKDAGCITYDLHQDNSDPSLFFYLENWKSKELLNKHLESEHFKAFARATKGLVEHEDVNLLTKIS